VSRGVGPSTSQAQGPPLPFAHDLRAALAGRSGPSSTRCPGVCCRSDLSSPNLQVACRRGGGAGPSAPDVVKLHSPRSPPAGAENMNIADQGFLPSLLGQNRTINELAACEAEPLGPASLRNEEGPVRIEPRSPFRLEGPPPSPFTGRLNCAMEEVSQHPWVVLTLSCPRVKCPRYLSHVRPARRATWMPHSRSSRSRPAPARTS